MFIETIKIMSFFDNPNDSVIVKRTIALDLSVKHAREEEYSQWTQFTDHKNQPFALADFVYANIADALPALQYNVLEILWIACCSDHEMYEQILGYSNSFLERTHPTKKNILRVQLAQFIQEIAETLQTIMEPNEHKEQKKQFQQYLSFTNENVILPGEIVLEKFRKQVHVLYYLPPNNVAIPYFLQVQGNFHELCNHSIVRHVCRALTLPLETPTVYEWLHVIEYVRHIGIRAYSLHGNRHMMNSKREWPGFLKIFYELFPDKSIPIEERFLQMITIYHPLWWRIFTLSGWRMNRQETAIITEFLHEFPRPFYQRQYITELFHLIV